MTSHEDDLAGTVSSLLRQVASTIAVPRRAFLMPGSIAAGRFQIETWVGVGGMGIVYRARDLRLNRLVALKLAFARARNNDSERLEQEARVMAQVGHPNVVTVYEVGTFDGQLFIAMAYMNGGTLRQWLAAKPRAWREVVKMFELAGAGLAAAHRLGVVHRDFKPENVLIDDEGRPQVADFGLASIETPEPCEPEGRVAGTLMTTATVRGTPAYMAPEQFDGASLDHRADLFAFCVSLHEALYGERPFQGETPQAIRESIDRGPRRVARVGPRRLAHALARGLAASPEDRYTSMNELLLELGRTRRQQPRTLTVAAVVSVAAVASVVAAMGRSVGQEGPVAEPPIESPADAPPPRAAARWDRTGRPDARAVPHPLACYSFDRDHVRLDRDVQLILDRCGDRHGVGSGALALDAGMSGESLVFSGGEHVELPRFRELGQQFTISVWVNMHRLPAQPFNPSIVDLWDHVRRQRAFLLGTFAGRIGANTSRDGLFREPMVEDPDAIRLHEWVHYAMSYDGAILTLYRDGRPVSSHARHATGPILPTDYDVWLGRSHNDGPPAFLVAEMDELAMWDVCLTPRQIAELY